MEDQERGVESAEKTRLSPGRNSRNPREITIMIMRSVGKIRSFKISTRIILLGFLFLMIYLTASIFIVNAYFFLRFDHHKQAAEITNLKGQLAKTEKDLLVSDQRQTLLKTFIEEIENKEIEQAAPETKNSEEAGGTPRTAEPPLSIKEPEEKRAEVSLVDVREMVIHQDGPKINVDFKLVNTRTGGDAVGGYIHIMMMGDRANIPAEWTYPREELKNGSPANYRRGLPFFIERFKPYNLEFQLKPGQSAPALVRVLVYNQSGVIILDGEFGLNNDS